MPNRILREGILTSERVATLNWQEEVFYRRLMSVVDDFGRYHANPKLLRAACYPLLIDKVSDADIGKWLTSCVTAALVSVYPAPDGKRYLQLLDFRQQARADKSKFPQMSDECIADATQVTSTREASAPVFGDVGVDVSVVERDAAKPPRATKRCPDSFAVTQELIDWITAELPGVDWQAETKTFRDYTFKTAIIDWPATWRNWMRKASTFTAKSAAQISFRERESAAAAARVHEMTGGLVSANKPRHDALQEVFDATPRLVG